MASSPGMSGTSQRVNTGATSVSQSDLSDTFTMNQMPDYWHDKKVSSNSKPPNSSERPNGNANVSDEAKRMHLVGQTIQFAQQTCLVKARVLCDGEELYALESNKLRTAYNGQCGKCNVKHVHFEKPNQGFYASVLDIHNKLLSDREAEEHTRGPKDVKDLRSEKRPLQPLRQPILGKNRGIEGNSNSCYMDSTIFCMFAYSNVFDVLLHKDVGKKQAVRELQRLLKENIVGVLRSEIGFVERDALFHLRALLSEATKDQSFREMEKDPSEFLRALEDLFQYAPIKTIARNQRFNPEQPNATTNIIWEMFDANPNRLYSTSIGNIFRNSLAENNMKLATIPPFLILVAPRHGAKGRTYPYIVPDRQITLDNDILQLVCIECPKTNDNPEQSRDFYYCKECYNLRSPIRSTDNIVICYCHGCLQKLHILLKPEERVEHHPIPLKDIKHKLNLFAVLCIETSHYVAFVKCRNEDQQEEWLFFDSMSDRISEKNIPCVSAVPNFNRWIDKASKDSSVFDEIDRRLKSSKPTAKEFSEDEMRQVRLFRDGAFFFYENEAANYQ